MSIARLVSTAYLLDCVGSPLRRSKDPRVLSSCRISPTSHLSKVACQPGSTISPPRLPSSCSSSITSSVRLVLATRLLFERFRPRALCRTETFTCLTRGTHLIQHREQSAHLTAFVLCSTSIYQFNMKGSSGKERFKAAELARTIANHRGHTKTPIVVGEQGGTGAGTFLTEMGISASSLPDTAPPAAPAPQTLPHQ